VERPRRDVIGGRDDERGLEKAREARHALEVADVRLRGAAPQRRVAAELRGPEGAELDGVAEPRARAVRLDQRDARARGRPVAGEVAVARVEDAGLGRRVRRREAVGPAVLADADAADDRRDVAGRERP